MYAVSYIFLIINNAAVEIPAHTLWGTLTSISVGKCWRNRNGQQRVSTCELLILSNSSQKKLVNLYFQQQCVRVLIYPCFASIRYYFVFLTLDNQRSKKMILDWHPVQTAVLTKEIFPHSMAVVVTKKKEAVLRLHRPCIFYGEAMFGHIHMLSSKPK